MMDGFALVLAFLVGLLAVFVGLAKSGECMRSGRQDLAAASLMPASFGIALICHAFAPEMVVPLHRDVVRAAEAFSLSMAAGAFAVFLFCACRRLRHRS